MRFAVSDSVVAATAIRQAAERAGHVVVGDDAVDVDLKVGAERDAGAVLTAVGAVAVTDALARGGALVVGAGLSPTLGTCLARVAAGDDDVSEVHVTYSLPMGRRDRDDDTVREVVVMLSEEGREWHLGETRRPRIAEGRRLAWFPAPIGPHHAVSLPLADAVILRRTLPVDTVTVSVAMRSWLAELVQVAGRGGALGSRLRRRFGRASSTVTETTRAAQRWAVVVEVVTPRGVTRAWANGLDLWAAHGDVVVAMAEEAAARRDALTTAAEVDGARLLDRLSDGGTLRWVVRRPTT